MQQNKTKTWRLVSLLIGAILLIGLVAGCGKDDEKADGNVVATFEGGEVTKEQFEHHDSVMKLLYGDRYTQLSMLDPNFKQSILMQHIAVTILSERASDEQVEEAKKLASENWQQYRDEMDEEGRADSLDQSLEAEGLTEDDLIEFVEKEMASYFYYRDQVKDEEVKDYYDQLLEQNANVFDRATVRHILVQTFDVAAQEEVRTDEEALERAEEVRQKLLNGESFEDLAEEYSDDPGSATNGGLYEDANINMWVENFKKAAIELPIGEISEPVKTDYGYHVMVVEDRYTLGLEELDEDIRMSIALDKYQQFVMEELPDLVDEDSLNLPES